METRETTYAQEAIINRITEKTAWESLFQDYSEHSKKAMESEYGDYSHGDYSDYYRVL